ncbi:carboxypeptidase regulatory-like domain-containing protein [Actinotalea sp. JY-7876]|uniref:carboxypeptidase regulatory-like domain-containing protein n=1 Tax=Actinotalea sp. JY-7876 TaxID=2758442 RepID=UPI0015F4C755|nr:carboxypeptidase regulatory-like domain-containing protein [Actinotalea sp. JY-7876]
MSHHTRTTRSRGAGLRLRVRSVAVLAIAALTAAGFAPMAAAADEPTPTGSISGRITVPAGVTAEVFEGMSVNAWDPHGFGASFGARVGLDGRYTIAEVPPGSYQVQVDAPDASDLIDEYYGATTSDMGAVPVTVTTGSVSGIDVALDQGGSASGTVTVPAGTDPAVVRVSVTSVVPGIWRSVNVRPDGTWSAHGLVPGDYHLLFEAYGTSLMNEYYPDAATSLDATPVTVAAGETTRALDVRLDVGGSISGTVQVPAGADVSRVMATASGAAGQGRSTQVAADGTFRIDGLRTGSYAVQFDAYGTELMPEYYDDAATRETAELVAVVEGQASTGVDAVLATGGVITGSVTVPSGVDPVSVYVGVMPIGGGQPRGAQVGADGTYRVAGLRTGDHQVTFSAYDSDLVTVVLGGAGVGGDPVSVVEGEVLSGVDATLVRGGAITGRVTVPQGHSVRDVSVWASADTGGGGPSAAVNADGTYRLGGLAAGSYRVSFSANTGNLVGEYYKDAYDDMTATKVEVVLGGTATGVDASLEAGASIEGVVRGTDGPLAGVSVSAQPVGGGMGGGTTTDAQGRYTIRGLRAADYTVSFYPSGDSPYVFEYYDDAASTGAAKAVRVTAGAAVRGVDATLALGGVVTGLVTGPEGAPLRGAMVSLQSLEDDGIWGGSATTAADGRYTVPRVPAGQYRVRVDPGADSDAVPGWWGGVGTPSTLTVSAGQTRAGIDVRLPLGGTVSGTVRAFDGSPVAGAEVYLDSDDGGGEGAFAVTAADGTYVARGVPAGSFTAWVWPGRDDLAPRYWRDKASAADADRIEIALGTSRAGIDFTLPPAGAVSGTVVVPAGYETYCVSVMPVKGSDGGADCYDAGEPYTVGGLASGTYVIGATAYDAETSRSTITLYRPATARRSSATPVAVTAPATVSGMELDLRSATVRGDVEPALTITSSPATPVPGRPTTVTLTAAGTAGVPTGVVELTDRNGFVTDAVLSGGKATFTYTFASADAWLDVSYSGDATYRMGGGYLEAGGAVPAAATTTTLTSSAPSTTVGTPVTVTATVRSAAGTPAGDVVFEGPGGELGRVPLAAGKASLPLTELPVGQHLITARYVGTAEHAASSGQVTQTVTAPVPPSISRVEPPSGSLLGGTAVTIVGAGFTGATSVMFGDTAATNVVVTSATTITATSPAGAVGTVPVSVATPVGTTTGTTAGSFTYVDYVAQTPARALSNGAVTPNLVRCLKVGGTNGVPAEATGAIMNVTAVRPNGPGYVVVYPDTAGNGKTPAPSGSTVNFEPGADVANSAFVALPANGQVCYQTRGAANVGVILDVTGYTLPSSGIVTQASQRLVDTRAGGYRVGDIAGPVAPRQVQTVKVRGEAGVPADATAVVLNVTVTGPTTGGNLRVFPAGQRVPNTSVVNFAAGQDKANGTIVSLPSSGEISFYSDSPVGVGASPVQVIIDVVGYVKAETSFTGVAPERILDTRPGAAHVGPIAGALTARKVYSVPVAGVGPVPRDATAVVLNVTAIRPSANGNLRVYPDSNGNGTTPPPNASAINYVPGRDIPNQVVVALPADGKVNFYSDMGAGTVNLAVDVVGYVTGDAQE